MRRGVQRLVLAAALVWSLAALVDEAVIVVVRQLDPPAQESVFAWRLGSRQVEPLARLTAAAEPVLPAGSMVAFATPERRPHVALFRHRWAAFLLPAHDLVPAGGVAARRAGYLLTYRHHRNGDPGLQPLLEIAEGGLYRIEAR